MSKRISITAKGDEGVIRTVSFEMSKKENKVFVNCYLDKEEKHSGTLEIKLDEFNNFCMDLFNENKLINK